MKLSGLKKIHQQNYIAYARLYFLTAHTFKKKVIENYEFLDLTIYLNKNQISNQEKLKMFLKTIKKD